MSKDDSKNLICDGIFRQQILANLGVFEVQSNTEKGMRRAAVALTIVELEDDSGVYGSDTSVLSPHHPSIVITRRASKLNSHAGQWALPGGRMDEGENAEQAALRELSEEVGLNLSYESIIGRLDDYTTRSGYIITPIIVWGGSEIKLTPNPAEVHSIYRIPVAELLREDAPLLDEMPELENPALMMPIGYSWIASPTGAILYQFREVAVLGNKTRVAHYEQPYFAWQ